MFDPVYKKIILAMLIESEFFESKNYFLSQICEEQIVEVVEYRFLQITKLYYQVGNVVS